MGLAFNKMVKRKCPDSALSVSNVSNICGVWTFQYGHGIINDSSLCRFEVRIGWTVKRETLGGYLV